MAIVSVLSALGLLGLRVPGGPGTDRVGGRQRGRNPRALDGDHDHLGDSRGVYVRGHATERFPVAPHERPRSRIPQGGREGPRRGGQEDERCGPRRVLQWGEGERAAAAAGYAVATDLDLDGHVDTGVVVFFSGEWVERYKRIVLAEPRRPRW